MKIPDKIKIGAHTIKVNVHDCIDDSTNIGEVQVATNTIALARKTPDGGIIPESMRTETLLHEILHYISIQAGYGIQEGKCTAYASSLLGVLRDNNIDLLDKAMK